MRLARPAAVLTAAALAGVALLSASAPASAGGPTSVLLVAPSTGQAEALHTANDAYARLMDLLDTDPQAETESGAAPPDVAGTEIVATWMIHDVQPWRIDRIKLDGRGMPRWIYTTQEIGGQVDGESPGVWHRPADQEALVVMLKGLGLMRGTTIDVADTSSFATEAPAGDDAVAPAVPPGDEGPGASLWALPALAAGGVAGVLGDRWLRRRREGGDGGRWQLVDVPGSTT